MTRNSLRALALAMVSLAGALYGQPIPAGYSLPKMTYSPDHRYGVLVPKSADEEKLHDPHNQVVEVKTGKVAGVIEGEAIFTHSDLLPPRWTPESDALLWIADGKWGYDTEILITLAKGKIDLQVNVLAKLQQEILTRVKAAKPAEYARVKTDGAGDGSWFKDGFAIDCVPEGGGTLDETEAPKLIPLKFPLRYTVYLASDVKGINPKTDVEARMTAELAKDGTIKVTGFHLGNKPAARTWGGG